MSFRKIDISELSFNPFEKIGKEWMLLTGGSIDDFNIGCHYEIEEMHRVTQFVKAQLGIK